MALTDDDKRDETDAVKVVSIPVNFDETAQNTFFANASEATFQDAGNFSVTFFRKPIVYQIPEAARAKGEVEVPLTNVARVYLTVDAAYELFTDLAQQFSELAAEDEEDDSPE